MGATLLGEKVEHTLLKGSHGSTFGANPVCCAAAISNMERLTDDFLAEVDKKSKFIASSLCNVKGVISVTGCGLMLGIETEKPASEIITKCLEKGLLVLSAKEKVRLLPPLNISYEELSKGLDILKGVIEE